MVVDLRVFFQCLVFDVVQTLVRATVQRALKEEYFFGLFVGEFFLVTAGMRVLLTPNLFFLVQNLGCVFPLEPVLVLSLVLLYAFDEAGVINIKAIANSIAGLTVLVLFCVDGLQDHLPVL